MTMAASDEGRPGEQRAPGPAAKVPSNGAPAATRIPAVDGLSLADAAMAYAQAGLAVFPVQGKRPAPMLRNGYKDASCDVDQIKLWWAVKNWNLGLPMGPNGLVCFDLDSDAAVDAWDRFMPTTATWTERTGRGLHLIFRAPEGVSFIGNLGVGSDTDIKHAGYIVAAPSVHADGSRYETVRGPEALADLPPALGKTTTRTTCATAPAVEQALDQITGDRSVDTARVVNAVVQAGGLLPDALAAVRSRRDLAERLDDRPDDDVARLYARYAGEELATLRMAQGVLAPVSRPQVDDLIEAAFYSTDEVDHPPAPAPTCYGAFGGPVPLFYAEGVHWLQGESESGKSWVALGVAVDVLAAGGRVAYLDYEDSRGRILERLISLGLPRDLVVRFAWLGPDTPQPVLAAAADDFDLLVVDGVTSALNDSGGDSKDPAERLIGWVDSLPRRFACSVMVDHVTKSRDNRNGWAYGSQAKKNVVTGSSWEVVCTRKFGRGCDGAIVLTSQKDKPGYLAEVRSTPVRLAFRSAADGAVDITVMGALELALEGLDRTEAFEQLAIEGVSADVSGRALAERMKEIGAGYGGSGAIKAAVLAEYKAYLVARDE